MLSFLSWCVFGLIAGVVARLLTPGHDPVGFIGTILVGVVGSFTGGFLASLIWGGTGDGVTPAGFIGSVLGGILLLLVLRKFRGPATA